jgi:hypothetical protein
VSGDRTSIVCYEGDRADQGNYARYELRLQHDGLTGAVTAGGSEEASPDSGNWRDHEIAALFNVLALAHSGTDRVTVKLSFDRGATFAQSEDFGAGAGGASPRLVQAAMAADYTLAVLFWVAAAGGTDLNLVLGRPSQVDGGGSPTHFTFDDPVVLHGEAGDVTPLPMGVAWSSGGDLVVGYGFTRFTMNEDRTWESLTQSRCAVRPFGGEFTDTVVDEDVVVGKDPSVAVTGAGAGLSVFFAFEGPQGVKLVVSPDGGATFSPLVALSDGSSHTPTVLARESGGKTLLDLFYVVDAAEGRELDLLRWTDYGAAAPEAYRLTTAFSVDAPAPPGPPPGDMLFAPPQGGRKVTQLAWLGYDAVVSGDDVVVVVDEETVAGWCWLYGAPFLGGAGGLMDAGMAPPAPFVPAEPPPLAPGMTEPVPPPDPQDMHQLKLLLVD